MSTDTRKTCTCTGTCRGAAGLGEGWVCALELPPATPSSAAAERCPKCGQIRVKAPYCWTWSCGSTEGPGVGFEQSDACRIRELQLQLADVIEDRFRQSLQLAAETQQLAAVTADRDRWAREAADSDSEVRGLQTDNAALLERVAKLERIVGDVEPILLGEFLRSHECPWKDSTAALMRRVREITGSLESSAERIWREKQVAT